MNIAEKEILLEIYKNKYVNQRELAERLNCSLGLVNRSIKNLLDENYLNVEMSLTTTTLTEIKKNRPRNAIILAAGFGMRMVPINMETPKALLEVDGEVLIERIINQLHDVDVHEIYIVVGFLKEQFEYLIDKYNVELIYNKDYAGKNNLHSLELVKNYISNSYIIPCDIWCARNPFSLTEMYSWYMVSEMLDEDSSVRINRKGELVSVADASGGNTMIGIAYILENEALKVRNKLSEMSKDRRYDHVFWEEALFEKDRMIVLAKLAASSEFVEINTYEQLRELDENSNQLHNDAIDVIMSTFHCKKEQITNIEILKKGMTNRSFLFKCLGRKYIMRIPGEGTSLLIDREKEAAVYRAIDGKGICDDVAYLNPQNGYKIAEYFEGARVCNPLNQDDLCRCMSKLKSLHEQQLVVDFDFDIWERIEFYESLWTEQASIYKDYFTTKKNVFSLKDFIEKNIENRVLTHIDAVPDNFLFVMHGEDVEIRLIDWEYAGMQDPHVDIAMFCIYSLYNRERVDNLIAIYFGGDCPRNIKTKIYCYIAACGLLWSNWCEYKRQLGVEFGEYSLRQYRYAKEYYRIVKNEGLLDE